MSKPGLRQGYYFTSAQRQTLLENGRAQRALQAWPYRSPKPSQSAAVMFLASDASVARSARYPDRCIARSVRRPFHAELNASHRRKPAAVRSRRIAPSCLSLLPPAQRAESAAPPNNLSRMVALSHLLTTCIKIRTVTPTFWLSEKPPGVLPHVILLPIASIPQPLYCLTPPYFTRRWRAPRFRRLYLSGWRARNSIRSSKAV